MGFNDLDCTYRCGFKSDLNTFNKLLNFIEQIKNSVITLEFAKRRQDTFRSHLNQVKGGNKSEEQKNI